MITANYTQKAYQHPVKPATAQKPQPEKKATIGFKGEEKGHVNPINKQAEVNIAAMQAGISSLALGGIASGLTALATKKIPVIAAIGLGTALLTAIPGIKAAMYKANVNATQHEKEMDVYLKTKSAESTLGSRVEKHVEEAPLDNAVATFQKYNLARKDVNPQVHLFQMM